MCNPYVLSPRSLKCKEKENCFNQPESLLCFPPIIKDLFWRFFFYHYLCSCSLYYTKYDFITNQIVVESLVIDVLILVHPDFRCAHRVFAQNFFETFAPLVGTDGPKQVGHVRTGVDLEASPTHPDLNKRHSKKAWHFTVKVEFFSESEFQRFDSLKRWYWLRCIFGKNNLFLWRLN